MKMSLFILESLVGTFQTIFRRVTKGRKRPTWTLEMELTQMSMRLAINHSLDWGKDWFRGFQDMSAKSFKKSPKIDYEKTHIADVLVEWFRYKEPKGTDKVIVYFHGGGYVYGNTDVYRGFLNDVVEMTETDVLSVDYRRAPEHPFPRAHDDAFAVVKSLMEGDFEAKQLILMGDSAGAGLCLGTLLSLKEAGMALPSATVLISPWVNPYADDNSIRENSSVDIGDRRFLVDCADKYLNGEHQKDPKVAPVYADLSGLTPMLIQIGTAEMLLDQSKALTEKAKQAGVNVQYTEYEDLFHNALIANRKFDACKKATEEIVDFVKKS